MDRLGKGKTITWKGPNVITSNKGSLVVAFRKLEKLAGKKVLA